MGNQEMMYIYIKEGNSRYLIPRPEQSRFDILWWSFWPYIASRLRGQYQSSLQALLWRYPEKSGNSENVLQESGKRCSFDIQDVGG